MRLLRILLGICLLALFALEPAGAAGSPMLSSASPASDNLAILENPLASAFNPYSTGSDSSGTGRKGTPLRYRHAVLTVLRAPFSRPHLFSDCYGDFDNVFWQESRQDYLLLHLPPPVLS